MAEDLQTLEKTYKKAKRALDNASNKYSKALSDLQSACPHTKVAWSEWKRSNSEWDYYAHYSRNGYCELCRKWFTESKER